MKKIGLLKKFAAVFLATAMSAAALTGCGTDSSAASGQADNGGRAQKIVLGLPGQDNNYQLELGNVAVKEGYLKEELAAAGYELETVVFAGAGPAINEAMAGGSIDGGIYADFPIITANANGIDTTIIAAVNNRLRHGVLAANGVAFNSPKDIEGKRVIVVAGTALQYAWDSYVEANGIDTSKVTVINASDAASLLSTGQADYYVSSYTAVKLLESKGIGRIVDSAPEVKIPVGQFVNIKTSYLKNNPDAAVAINKALLRAYDAVKADSEVLYKDLTSTTYTREIVEDNYSSDLTFANLNPEISDNIVSNVQSVADYMYKNSFITSKVDAKKIVDKSYYEKAKSEYGR